MSETITLGELSIRVTRNNVKHAHLSVYPPDGAVTLVVPDATRLDVAHTYAISKLGWIQEQQQKLEQQARETPRKFNECESDYLWSKRYLLAVDFADAKPQVKLDRKRITLTVRPGNDAPRRADIMHECGNGGLRK